MSQLTPHPIYEHWTEADLLAVLETPDAVDVRIVEACRVELDRRAAARARVSKAEQDLEAAKSKIEAHKEAERVRKLKEQRRAEALTPKEEKPGHARKQTAELAAHFGGQAHSAGSRVHGFLLEALAMACREGREAELLELLRPTQFARRWTYQHPRDMSIIVTFDEVFPAPARKRAAAEQAA